MRKIIVLLCVVSVAISASPVSAMPNEKRLSEYYAVDEGGKCGYIDSAGRYIIPAKYDRANPFLNRLASVTIGYDTHFIDPSGKIVFSLPDRMRSFGFDERDETAVIESRTGKGFIDRTGKIIVQPVYHDVRPFGGDLSDENPSKDRSTTTVNFGDARSAIIDRTGKVIFGPRKTGIGILSDGIYKLGGPMEAAEYYDRNFKQIKDYQAREYSPPVYDETKFDLVSVWHESGFAEAQVPSKVGEGKWGILNRSIQWVVQPIYDELFFNDDSDELSYIHGRRGQKWGFIDITGKEVIPFAFDRLLPFVGNHAPAALGNRWGLIDRSGKWKLQPKYDDVEELSDVAVAVQRGGLWGIMDYSGQWLIEPRFQSVGHCQGRDFTLAEQMFEAEGSPMVKEFEGALGGIIQEMDKKANPPKQD